MIKAVLFDLDGTLLPMDQDIFVNSYIKRMAGKMYQYGYDPQMLIKGIWAGTGAMVQNDGTKSNEALFWDVFCSVYGKNVRTDEPLFQQFYEEDFQLVKGDCGFDPRAAETIQQLRKLGYRLVLATNPLFPAVATHSRVRWAGLSVSDFEWITTYENSYHCKPNPLYYKDILNQIHLSPEECIMVGNDVNEDMVAASLGMKVFLMTDCLINKDDQDISSYPYGSFPELMQFIGR